MIPRPRLAIRWLLIVATILGVALAGEKLRRVSRGRSLRAAELAAEAESCARDASATEKLLADPGGVDEAERKVRLAEIRDAVEGYRTLGRYNRDLADRYERAAYRPWTRMGPEPPPPGWSDDR